MNILLPIVSNAIIALILILGMLSGIRVGGKRQLVKTLLTAGLAVGLFFLSPIITGALLSIEAISQLVTLEFLVIATQVVYFATFMITYFIINGIETLIAYRTKKKVTAKSNQGRNAARTNKQLSKEEKKILKNKAKVQRKNQRKEFRKVHKTSRRFGLVLGFINSFVILLVLLIPISSLKYITDNKVYDSTFIGIVDNTISEDKTTVDTLNEYLVKELVKDLNTK